MTEDSKPNLLQVYHININCTNLERTVAFYRLLGFKTAIDFGEPVEDLPTGFAEIGLGPILGLPDELAGRAVLMGTDNDPRSTKLDILEWTNPIVPTEPRKSMAQPGVARIALKVRDIAAVHQALIAAGHGPYTEPRRVTIAGTPVLLFCVEDPDGTVIEFMQFKGA